MDKVEIFGNVAHYMVLRVEKALLGLEEYTDDVLEFITDKAGTELHSFERQVQGELVGQAVSETLMNFVEIGMCGYQYAKGGQTHVGGLANAMTDLYARKNRDYGNSFDKSMDKFGMVVSAIRIGDKVNRLQSLVKKKGQVEVKDESIADTFMDLACYAIMTQMWLVCEGESEEKEEEYE